MVDEIHKRVHLDTTMAYQQGVKGNRVLFVFESPGRFEHELQRPAVGETGVHLCMLCEKLRFLAAKSQNKFVRDIGKDFCKVGASIINIAPDWLPWKDEAQTKRKSASELLKEEKMKYAEALPVRLNNLTSFANVHVILCFGQLSWDVAKLIEEEREKTSRSFCIITTYHLSGRASKCFDGGTWCKKMEFLSHAIYEKIQEWVSTKDVRVFDLTCFSQKYKQIANGAKNGTNSIRVT